MKLVMRSRDTIELLLLGALWGASFLFMRVAVSEFGPLALIEVRVAVAAIALSALLGFRGQFSSLRGLGKKLLITGAVNSAIPFTLFAYCTLSIPASYAAVLNATAPLFSVLVAFVWFGERLHWMRWVGLIVGFIGVVILVSERLGASGSSIAIGLAIAAGLFAAFLYGVATQYSKRAFEGVPPLTISTGTLISASLILLPTMITHSPSKMPSGTSWICAVLLGIGCTGVAYVLFFRLLRNLGPSKAMTVAYLIPAFAILWGYVVLGESITGTMLTGGCVILFGTTLVNRSK